MQLPLDHITSQLTWLSLVLLGLYLLSVLYLVPELRRVRKQREKVIDGHLNDSERLLRDIEKMEHDIKLLSLKMQTESAQIREEAVTAAAEMIREAVKQANDRMAETYSNNSLKESRRRIWEAKMPEIVAEVGGIVKEVVFNSYSYDEGEGKPRRKSENR